MDSAGFLHSSCRPLRRERARKNARHSRKRAQGKIMDGCSFHLILGRRSRPLEGTEAFRWVSLLKKLQCEGLRPRAARVSRYPLFLYYIERRGKRKFAEDERFPGPLPVRFPTRNDEKQTQATRDCLFSFITNGCSPSATISIDRFARIGLYAQDCGSCETKNHLIYRPADGGAQVFLNSFLVNKN